MSLFPGDGVVARSQSGKLDAKAASLVASKRASLEPTSPESGTAAAAGAPTAAPPTAPAGAANASNAQERLRAIAQEGPTLTFEQQRARQFVQVIGEGKTYLWNAPVEPAKGSGKSEPTNKELADEGRTAKIADHTGKLIRMADGLQNAILRLDDQLAKAKDEDLGRLNQERADLKASLEHVIGELRAKASQPVVDGDSQRAREWSQSWFQSYPVVSGYKGEARPKRGTGIGEFETSADAPIGDLLRAEAGLFGLYHRNLAEAERLEEAARKGTKDPDAARDKARELREEAHKAKARTGEVEGWLRAKAGSPNPFERARANDWLASFQPKSWDLAKDNPGKGTTEEAKGPNPAFLGAKKSFEEADRAKSTGNLIRVHDELYGATMRTDMVIGEGRKRGESADWIREREAEKSRLGEMMGAVKGMIEWRGGNTAAFEQQRSRQWLADYSATYQAPAGTTKPAPKDGIDAFNPSAGAPIGEIIRSLLGLNGMYHRNMIEADRLEEKAAKGGDNAGDMKAKAKALRDEAAAARNRFDEADRLMAAKAGSAVGFERARVDDWFKERATFSWDHKATGGAGAGKPAEEPVGPNSPVSRLIAKFDGLYREYKNLMAEYAKDKDEAKRNKAESARTEAGKVQDWIRAKA